MGKKDGSIIEISGYHKASFNFSEDAVGAEGTDIGFIDIANLFDGELIIVETWQNHKHVLRIKGDSTPYENPQFSHSISEATSGIIEIYFGVSDATKNWSFGLLDGELYVVTLRIADSALDYLDNALAWQLIQAVSSNTLYHIKMVWRADNTFDVYVGQTKKVTNQPTTQNQSGGVDSFYVSQSSDSVDYAYVDAYGMVGVSGYTEGDNLTMEAGGKDGSITEI